MRKEALIKKTEPEKNVTPPLWSLDSEYGEKHL
jgi:hypothetical protein